MSFGIIFFGRICGSKVGKNFEFTCKINLLRKYVMSLEKNEFFQ